MAGLVGPTESADIIVIDRKKVVCRGSVIRHVVPQGVKNMILRIAEAGDVKDVITADHKLIVIGILIRVRNFEKVPILFRIDPIPINWSLVCVPFDDLSVRFGRFFMSELF